MREYRLKHQAISEYLESRKRDSAKVWCGDMEATQGIYRLLSRAPELTESEIKAIAAHIYIHSQTKLEKPQALNAITKELIEECFEEI